MDNNNSLNEIKCTQLEVLQTRIGLHGNRMWQLPLTYLGTIAISLSAMTSEGVELELSLLFAILSVLGVLLLWALWGAHEGYDRTAKNMIELEKELGLTVSTKHASSHSLPYFALMLFGVLCCLSAAFYL